VHRELVGGAQAQYLRVPLADGTLVATPDVPPDDLVPSFLSASDVLGTGWFAERIIAMSRHEQRQKLALDFGATDLVTERGDEGVARVKELTGGLGAHSVIEAVGTQQSMTQAIGSTRPGGYVGYVGVSHGVALDGQELFYSHVHLHGGPAPVREYLPQLIDLIWNRHIDPGKVFDLQLPLDGPPLLNDPRQPLDDRVQLGRGRESAVGAAVIAAEPGHAERVRDSTGSMPDQQ
jgi:threonine dehydrogenase-like Zn-dependent dehydrogenase